MDDKRKLNNSLQNRWSVQTCRFYFSFYSFSSLVRLKHKKSFIMFDAANISITRDVKNSLHFANFVKHKFKYLNVKPFMSLHVPNKKKCQVSCVKDLQCLSFNVGVFPNSDGQFQCELLATDMFNSSRNMTPNANYNHYSIQVFYLETLYSFSW
jgi:hypothetical protein